MDPNDSHETQILPPRPSTGQLLKHFRLESLLGEGGMGTVYRAQDTQLCRPVAVKVLPPQLTADVERKNRFLLEARAAARISHPAVAQIYYVDEQDGVTFIVMELVEGKTLREIIHSGELDVLGVMDVVIQAADGLAKAHEMGIVHRDIKPANIMVTSDAHVKILDFGLAKLLDRPTTAPGAPATAPATDLLLAQTTTPGVVMGTAAYMSPEQVRGVAVDARADVFSLGVLLFELATGKSPFLRENFMDTLHAVAFEEPPDMVGARGHLPDELQRIVARCLRKNPEERYSDARLLARDLRALRRQTESGLLPKSNWRLRMVDAWERLRHASPSRYLWVGAAAAGLGLGIYLSLSRVGLGGAIAFAIPALMIYRHVRGRSLRLQDQFIRQVSKIPEVRLILLQRGQFTVVVDRPAAQLYTRINQNIRALNRKLYFGDPMSVAIQHGLAAEQTRTLLSAPGVQFVREDVLRGLE